MEDGSEGNCRGVEEWNWEWEVEQEYDAMMEGKGRLRRTMGRAKEIV